MGSKERVPGYDLIRIIAIVMVVAIHSNVSYLAAHFGDAGWMVVMEWSAVCVVAVPLFFMISGAMLLDVEKPISIQVLFKQRIPKQAVPFLIWSLIYVLARIGMGKIPFAVSSFTHLLHEPAYYQFWFMYTLLAIYLFLPFFQMIVIYTSKRQLQYLLMIWLVFSILVPTAQRFIPGFSISEHVDLIVCEGYAGYFLLGYYLKKYPPLKRKRSSLLLGLLGFTVTGVSAWVEWIHSGNGMYSGYVYSAYLLPGVVITVIGLFLTAGQLQFTRKGTAVCLQYLNSLTMDVFYVHMLVMTAIEYFAFDGSHSIALLLLKWCLTVIGSFLIAAVIRSGKRLIKHRKDRKGREGKVV